MCVKRKPIVKVYAWVLHLFPYFQPPVVNVSILDVPFSGYQHGLGFVLVKLHFVIFCHVSILARSEFAKASASDGVSLS